MNADNFVRSAARQQDDDLDLELLQRRAREWLEHVLEEHLPPSKPLSELLADGTTLLDVSEAVLALYKKRALHSSEDDETQSEGRTKSAVPRQQTLWRTKGMWDAFANVDKFLKVCREVGLTDLDLCLPADVVEQKNIRRVCLCLRTLAIRLHQLRVVKKEFEPTASSGPKSLSRSLTVTGHVTNVVRRLGGEEEVPLWDEDENDDCEEPQPRFQRSLTLGSSSRSSPSRRGLPLRSQDDDLVASGCAAVRSASRDQEEGEEEGERWRGEGYVGRTTEELERRARGQDVSGTDEDGSTTEELSRTPSGRSRRRGGGVVEGEGRVMSSPGRGKGSAGGRKLRSSKSGRSSRRSSRGSSRRLSGDGGALPLLLIGGLLLAGLAAGAALFMALARPHKKEKEKEKEKEREKEKEKEVVEEIPSNQTEYTVQKGEYLIKIAGKVGKKRWQELHEANPDISNPNLIYPNAVLKLE